MRAAGRGPGDRVALSAPFAAAPARSEDCPPIIPTSGMSRTARPPGVAARPPAYTYYSPDPLTLVLTSEVDSSKVPRASWAPRGRAILSPTGPGDGVHLARIEVKLLARPTRSSQMATTEPRLSSCRGRRCGARPGAPPWSARQRPRPSELRALRLGARVRSAGDAVV